MLLNMRPLKKKISKHKLLQLQGTTNYKPLIIFPNSNFNQDEKKELIIQKNLNLYLKELSFEKSGLNLFLPKKLQVEDPSLFVTKTFINEIYEEIQRNTKPASLLELFSFFRKIITIDIVLESEEIAKGLVFSGFFLVIDAFFNQNIIYFSFDPQKTVKNDNQNKYFIIKSMEIVINLIKEILDIVNFDIVGYSFFDSLNNSILNYLEKCPEYEPQNIALQYFDEITKIIAFKHKINMEKFFHVILSKISQTQNKSLENNILCLRILYNLGRFSELPSSLKEQFSNFEINQREIIMENIFVIVSVKIFEEFSNLLNNLQAKTFQPPKKSKQKFLKEFSLDQHIKEGISIWFSSANSLELALDLLNDIYASKDENNFEDEDYIISINEVKEEMELENEETSIKFENFQEKETENNFVDNKIDIEMKSNYENNEFFESIGKNLREFGLEKLLIDKIILPTKNQIDFIIFYQIKLGNIFKKIKKIIYLTINCFINLFYSSEKLEDNTEIVTILLKAIKDILIITEDIEKNQVNQTDFSEEIDLKDILAGYIKLLCLIIERNQTICAIIPANELIYLFEHLKNVDKEAFLLSFDILSVRFLSKFSNIQENEELCKVFLKLFNQKNNNIMILGQSLNCIFDIFQDEKFDQNFTKFHFLEHLKKNSGNLKKGLQKNTFNILKKIDMEFLNEVYLNLKRFIIYKEKKLLNH